MSIDLHHNPEPRISFRSIAFLQVSTLLISAVVFIRGWPRRNNLDPDDYMLFYDHIERGFKVLFYPNSGYLQTYNRLIIALISGGPVEELPNRIYVVTSFLWILAILVIQLLAIRISGSVRLGIGIAFVFAIQPLLNSLVLGVIVQTGQIWLFVLLMSIAFQVYPTKNSLKIVFFILIAILGLSNPLTICLVPALILTSWRKSGSLKQIENKILAIITICFLFQTGINYFGPTDLSGYAHRPSGVSPGELAYKMKWVTGIFSPRPIRDEFFLNGALSIDMLSIVVLMVIFFLLFRIIAPTLKNGEENFRRAIYRLIISLPTFILFAFVMSRILHFMYLLIPYGIVIGLIFSHLASKARTSRFIYLAISIVFMVSAIQTFIPKDDPYFPNARPGHYFQSEVLKARKTCSETKQESILVPEFEQTIPQLSWKCNVLLQSGSGLLEVPRG